MSPDGSSEDALDLQLAQAALEQWEAGGRQTVSLEELAAELGWELSDLADESA